MMFKCKPCSDKDRYIENLNDIIHSSCKVCAEKDQRISDLKEQIQYLRDVLNPPARIQEDQKYLSPMDAQADKILGGAGEEESTLPQDGNQEDPAVLAERAAMLSGTY